MNHTNPDTIVAVFSNMHPKDTHTVLYTIPGNFAAPAKKGDAPRLVLHKDVIPNQQAAELLRWLEKCRQQREMNPEFAKAGSIKTIIN